MDKYFLDIVKFDDFVSELTMSQSAMDRYNRCDFGFGLTRSSLISVPIRQPIVGGEVIVRDDLIYQYLCNRDKVRVSIAVEVTAEEFRGGNAKLIGKG